MKQITFLIALAFATICQAQFFPVDYEDGTTTAAFQFNGAVPSNIPNPDMNNNSSTRVLRVEKSTTSDGGNPAAWFSGFGYNGSGNIVDLSNGTTITMKIWSPRPNVPVRVRLQGGPSPAYNFDFVTGSAGQVWEDITMDFAAANPGITGSEAYPELVIQPNFDPACETPGSNCVITTDDVFFIDDLDQPNTTTPTADASLSDLAVDGTTIMGFASNVRDYTVDVAQGTSTVPTVTAVATQAGSGASAVAITPAGALPGTTLVDVTAPDGVTTRQYTVNFVFQTVPPTGIAPQFLSDGTNLIVYSDVAPGANDNVVSNFNLDVFGGGARAAVDLDNDSTNETYRLQDVPFYGAQWDAVDLTTLPYNFVHMHYYSESVDEFRFFLIDQSANIPGGNPEEPRFVVSNSGSGDAMLVQSSWQSVFMPLSVFTNFPTPNFNYDLNDIFQYKFETTGGIMYFDNVFFSTTSTLSTQSFSINSLLISPNPTRDVWNFNDAVNTIQSITLYDMTGKLITSQQPNASSAQLDGSSLNAGIYLADVVTDAGRETVKIIKQ